MDDSGDVGERSKDGFTPLLAAAYFGYIEVCELLLVRGKADIEERTLVGNRALKLAATKCGARTVDLLVSKGAKVNVKSKDGFTPLLAAIKNGDRIEIALPSHYLQIFC